MKNWTKQAEEQLEEYLENRFKNDGLMGGDFREMKEDLKTHIYEETEALEDTQIGTSELGRVLSLLEKGHWVEEQKPGWQPSSWISVLGVWAPLIIIVIEMLTGMCGATFFDPIATWFHVLLVLLVPSLNWWILKKRSHAASHWIGAAAGVTTVISGFYALLFVPLLPASVIALLIGIGVLSLVPIATWGMSWWISQKIQKEVHRPWRYRRAWWAGAGLAGVMILLLEGPETWTRWNLSKAISEDPELAQKGLSRLRSFHSERTLLRACYEGNRGTSIGTDISGWFRLGWNLPLVMAGQDPIRGLGSKRSRDLFFLVTGKPFNASPPPSMVRRGSFLSSRGNAFEGFEFDSHLGGDSVAIRLKDLDLVESRFDGHVDTVSQIGYGEWTMVFQNRSGQAKEARCQVRLPRGGRVSRLTLWVNGEPREAAFNTVEKVKKAYRSVAVVQRKDPVLVTMAGPDTIMVQCFPVPAHGEMKIRFGVTASLDGARWELPRIVERNFGIAKTGEHALWLQANEAFEFDGLVEVAGSAKDGEGFSTNALVKLERILGKPLALQFASPQEAMSNVWCEDSFAPEQGRFLSREITNIPQSPIEKLIIVIDGSVSMKREAWKILSALREFQSQCEFIIADDGATRLPWQDLHSYHFSGGRDNEHALREAISIAKTIDHSAVIWLHGPQAVELTKSQALIQLLERGTHRPHLYEIEVVSGPNRLAEALGKEDILQRGPTMFDVRKDLTTFVGGLLKGKTQSTWKWKRAASPDGFQGKKVWDHLARIWAMQKSKSDDPKRAKIAARYQLVTSVSGAVVLETMAQFKEHGLTPVDTATTPTVPSIPEPSTSFLMLLTMCWALGRRRRKT